MTVRFRLLQAIPGLIAIAVLTLMAAMPAQGQPSGAQGDDFIYGVRAGDTLIDLSRTYTGTPGNWPLLQTLNAVADPYALPIGKALRIPFSLIPEEAANARVVHIDGQARINGRAPRLGDTVVEGDILQTGAASFLTLQLPDGSQATLPAGSKAQLRRLRSFVGTGLGDTILQLESGAVESDVAPDGQGTGRYEIHSPISITGVRGTQLRVRMGQQGGSLSEVIEGVAHMQAGPGTTRRLQALQGAGVRADGQVLPVRALPAAPRLHPPAASERVVNFDTVPGAQAYLVRVASDEKGMRPVYTRRISGPPAEYPVPGPGDWYLLVRAIDDAGLMGEDAVWPFEGHAVLMTGFGEPVRAGQGGTVQLTLY
ncbi:MAG: FecR domain-containing protein [Castellaniella sp.]